MARLCQPLCYMRAHNVTLIFLRAAHTTQARCLDPYATEVNLTASILRMSV